MRDEIMNKTKYGLKHIRCNMDDFLTDKHRFSFWYNGQEHTAVCFAAGNIFFDTVFPEDVQLELRKLIWHKIDTEESRWRYPAEAYKIANKYCAENFV